MNSLLAAVIATNNARRNNNSYSCEKTNSIKCDISKKEFDNDNRSVEQFKKILLWIILLIDIIVFTIFLLKCH